ncbi:MAG: hypothetical protein K2F92_03000 [Alistipes sp.]|nr:hypothetical protein [Alistipes sp.]
MKNALLPIALLGLLLAPALHVRAGITAPEILPQPENTVATTDLPTEKVQAEIVDVGPVLPEETGTPIEPVEVEREIEAVAIDAMQNAMLETGGAIETEPGTVETESEAQLGEVESTVEMEPKSDESEPGVAEIAPESTDTLRESDTDSSESSAVVSPRGMRLKKRFLPTSRRIDREINKNRFVFKGETMFGLTVSYGTLSTDDADIFPIFENIDLSGNITTVNPFVGYFYRDNRCFGVRFGYTHISGRLNALGINLGEQNDIELEIPWLDLTNDRYSFGVFHRTYVPIDEKGRFAVFGEIELSMSTGQNTFAYKSGDDSKRTSSKNTTVKAWVNPGVAVYAFPNVCASISFGLGGFKYTHIRQYDDQGVKTGERHYSKMNLRLNIADIRIGVTVHLWNKKKGDRT